MIAILNHRHKRASTTGSLLLTAFVLCIVIPSPRALAYAEALPSTPKESATGAEVDALIKVLQDPSSRQRLINQLKALSDGPAQGVQPSKSDEAPTVRAAGAEILRSLTEQVLSVSERTFLPLARVGNQLPQALNWMYGQITNPQTRPRWSQLLISLATIMGAGYVAFVVIQLPMARSKRKLVSHQPPRNRLARLSALAYMLALDLLAAAVFAVVAYLALSLINPTTEARVVALAWIGAATAVRALMALTRFLFAPDAAELRLWPLSDETAHYALIWARRLSLTPIYGYVALEVAVVLGLPQNLFAALLAFLGLLVSALILILVWQNREIVANLIRGTAQERKGPPLRALRERLATLWHLLASIYVISLFGVWLLQVPGGFRFIMQASALSLLVIGVATIALRLVAHAYQRGIRLSTELRARFPGIEGRVNRYFSLLHAGARWIVYAIAVFGLLEAWGIDSSGLLSSEPARVLAGTFGTLLLIIFFAIALWELTSSIIDRELRETDTDRGRHVPSPRVKTLLAVARNAVFATITVVTSLLVLSELGINIAPLLAGAGVVGLAVGFGAQTLVKDIITGAIILFQDLVAVGEVVKVGDTAGLVEAISIRHIRLRDLSGTVHTIPFSAISTISNLTKDFSFYVFDIAIAYREDVDRVMEVLVDLGAELQQDPEFGPLILAPLEILGVDRFADSAVIIKARIKTLPIQQWTVGRQFNRRLKRRFDELGIEIPFPHRTLYFGIDRQGDAPPARVQLAGGVSLPPSPGELLHSGERAHEWQQRLSGLTDIKGDKSAAR